MANTTTPPYLCPLESKIIAGHYGAYGETGIVFGRRRLRSLWQIAGWDDFDTTSTALLRKLGLPGPGNFRQSQQNGETTSWRIAPDKLLLEGPATLPVTQKQDLVMLDLSHARIAITLYGPAARDLLMQVIAVDMEAGAFTPGEFLQTGIHHVGVLVHCLESERFEVIVPVTWAETIWELLCDNAAPYGYHIDGPDD